MTNTDQGYVHLSKERRDLYLRIVDFHHNYDQITLRLFFLEDHFPPDKLDRALKWLISNNITGPVFIAWFYSECKNSDLEMHRLLVSIVDNLSLDRLVAGRNFKV